MIKTYQEERTLKKALAPVEPQTVATIGTVHADGATLIFDDSETESAKHYKSNKAITFVSGDRVKIVKLSGTYVIEYAL